MRRLWCLVFGHTWVSLDGVAGALMGEQCLTCGKRWRVTEWPPPPPPTRAA